MGYWKLILPALELATIWWLVSRIAYTRYPALLTHLAVEAVAQAAAILAGPSWAVAWFLGQFVRMPVRAWVVFEVYRFGCIRTSWPQRLKLAGYAVAGSAVCAGAAWLLASLSPYQSFIAGRQYYFLTLAGALIGICIRTKREPIPENRDHWVYRYCMTAQAVRAAIGATFIKGGFAYKILPYERATWETADVVLWAASCVLTVTLAWGMTSNVSCLRPEIAFPELFGDKPKQRRAAA
jgi:hypothetical protein